MSIALERGGSGIGGKAGGFISCIAVYDSPDSDGRRVGPPEEEERSESSSCSSSIGRNSDCSAAGGEEDAGEAEVQSPYKGPLDTMDSLEESLPIRRGVSKYYCGKSKSFTSLADAASSCVSAKDLAKPENPFNRKRKNLLASSTTCDKTRQYHNNLPRSIQCSISKRSANSSRSTLNLATSTSSSGSNGNSSEEEHEPPRLLPPLHPRSRPTADVSPALFTSYPHEKSSFPMRSFSLTDLEGVNNPGFSLHPRDKHKRF